MIVFKILKYFELQNARNVSFSCKQLLTHLKVKESFFLKLIGHRIEYKDIFC